MITAAARDFGKTRETGDEVAQAILDISGGNPHIAERIWAQPTDHEQAAIQEAAFAMTDEPLLFWGRTLYRYGDLRRQVLGELSDRYTGLPDDYRRYVDAADIDTLRAVLDMALDEAPGRKISAALGIEI
jgi:hypothetical protein